MKTKHTPRDPMTPKKSQEFRASRVFPRRTKKRTNIDWPTACTVCGPFYLSQGWKSFSKRSFLSIVILHSAMHFTLFFRCLLLMECRSKALARFVNIDFHTALLFYELLSKIDAYAITIFLRGIKLLMTVNLAISHLQIFNHFETKINKTIANV